ncbi:MAG: Flp pilus assembly pilin Flp [Alphaproteobacteria bacterium]|jgi:Flp pilus assembly pilin Flp
MITYLKKFLYNESGVIALEYALGLATLGMVIVLGMTETGTTVRNYMLCISTGGGVSGQDSHGNILGCVKQ